MRAKQKERNRESTSSRVWYVPFVAAVFLIVAAVFLERLDTQRFQQDQKISVVNKLSTIRARLEGDINSNSQLIISLIAEFSLNPDITQEEFSRYAKIILEQKTQIRNIGAARDLVITHIYPLKGNEKALGLDFNLNEKQKAAALKAKEIGGIFVAGPVDLVQGGRGFIARTPVYVSPSDGTNNRGRFWGLISAVIDVDRLYADSGLTGPNHSLEIAMRGKDSMGPEGEVFFGRPGIFENLPVLLGVSLPHGSWQLAAIPKGGWTNEAPNAALIRSVGIVGFLFFTGFGFYREKQRQEKQVVEKALRMSEERFRDFAVSSSDWLWETDVDGRLIWQSVFDGEVEGRAFVNIKGMTREEISGDLMADTDWSSYRQALQEHKDIVDFEYRYYGDDGNVHYAVIDGKPMFGDSGVYLGHRGAASDITVRKQADMELRESEQRFRSIFNYGIGGIAVTAPNGKIIQASQTWLDTLGFTAEELHSLTPLDLTHPDDREESYRQYQELIDGKISSYLIEKRYVSKAGETIWVIVGVSPVKNNDGEILYTVGEFVNITDRKNAEKELRQAHDQLEQRVHERTEQLRGEVEERKRIQDDLLQANTIADAANRAKSDLMANMSHELRTPLNAIIGFSETMKRETFGPLGNAKYREYLDDIHLSGQHLLDLINDILDVSAIEAGAVELHEENVNLFDLVEITLRIINPRADDGRVTVSSSIDSKSPLIYGDERRVKQVLLNLLSNAVKFTPEGGEVSISSWLNEEGSLAIAISDTGIGMDKEEVRIALNKFEQIDSGLNRRHEGTGLGLPLTKGLMDLHGGTLEVESKKGQGTMITVTFPKERVILNPD